MNFDEIKAPLISVILPVYNGEKFLAEAIDSILQQTESDFELIIINDGSTDSTLEIINSYDDSRIKIVSRSNRGLVASLNEGLDLARGVYIARMDADDYSRKERFEQQVKLMQLSELDICGCDFNIINEKGEVIDFKKVSTNLFPLVLMSNVPFAHGSVMIRKSFLRINNLEYGKTKYDKAEDYHLWCAVFEHGGVFGNVPECLFEYRDVEGSLSSNKKNMYHACMISYEFMKINENKITQCILAAEDTEISCFNEQIAYFALMTIFNNFKVKCSMIANKKIFMLSLIRVLKVFRIRLLSKFND